MSKPVAGEGVTRPAVVQKSRAVRLTLIVAACCMVGLACAPRAIADETLIKKKFTHHAAVRGKAVAPVITKPDPAMLEPAAAPDCAFGGTMSNPATVEQTRAKLTTRRSATGRRKRLYANASGNCRTPRRK